ncbi:MAG: zinc ribbon domain-containing protein [Candidatus Hermodarchaeota archaeon]
MSENYQNLERFTNKRYSGILSAGFSFFGKNWLKLIIPFGIFLIIAIIVKDLIMVDLNWQNIILTPQLDIIIAKDPSMITNDDLTTILHYLSNLIVIGFLDSLIRTSLGVFSMCLFSSFIYKKFIGDSPKLSDELKTVFNPKIIGVLLLLGLGIPLGTFLIFIPSILILGFYSFSIFTFNSKTINNSIKEARNISRGSFWKVIGIFVISNLVIWGINFIYQNLMYNFLAIPDSWYNPLSRDIGMIIVYDLLYNIIEILLSPLFICLLCALYVHLRAKTMEGPIYTDTSNLPRSDNKGFYCPYCGQYINQLRQYCPNCGGKLDFEI